MSKILPVAASNKLFTFLLPVFIFCCISFSNLQIQAAVPTDITLSASTVAENRVSGTTVGTFTSTPAGTYTYSLVTGTGSNDNGYFTINGTTLQTAYILDFEQKSSYSIRVKTTNAEGSFEKVFPIAITDVAEEPTDIMLSKSTIMENAIGGTPVGAFTTTDPTNGDSFYYQLVGGSGSTDNSSFNIVGSSLRTADTANFDFETKKTYYIRVRTTDMTNSVFEKPFVIYVTDVNEAPTNVKLSANTVAENSIIGTPIGTFSSTDQDANNTFTYSLVSGTGSTDNASFNINATSLETAAIFDYDTIPSYSIRVRTTDQDGLYYEKIFTINVTNVNEVPTDITLSLSTVAENQNIGTLVSVISTTDPDANNIFTYTLVSGIGSTDNSFFYISYNKLYTTAVFDFETKNTYSILIRTTDQGGLYLEKALIITVTDVNDAPVAKDDSYFTPQSINLTVLATGVLTNDTDADSNPVNQLTAVKVSDPSHGTVTLSSNGSFIYRPTLGYCGIDSFTYKVFDGVVYSNTATVTIYVNGPPIANNDTEIRQSFVSPNVPISILDNNTITSSLTVSATGTIQRAIVTLNVTHAYDGDLTVTLVAPDGTKVILAKNNGGAGKNYTDTIFDDSSTVLLSSGTAPFTNTYHPVGSLSTLAGKSMSGNWGLQVNDNSDGDIGILNSWSLTFVKSFTVAANSSLIIGAPGVLCNDTKFNSGNYSNPGSLSAVQWSNPAHGSVTGNSDGSFSYTPTINYFGTDSFTYKANDGTFNSNAATVTIVVTSINVPPIANNDSYSISEDAVLDIAAPGVLTNDTDANGDTLTALLVAGPSHGSFMFNANGSFRYTPVLNYNGTDSFTYRTFDTKTYSATTTVNLTINPVNDSPTDINLSSTTIAENQPSGSTVGNFSTADIDTNDTFTYTFMTGTGSADNASFSITGNALLTNTTLNYEAKSIYNIRVRSTDLGGSYFDKTFTIKITNINEAPTGISLSNAIIIEHKAIGTTVGTLTSIDPDGDTAFTYTLVSGTGSTDNNCFTITGNTLQSAAILDYTSSNTYSIRVQTMDLGGLVYQQVFTIYVTAPPVLSLPASSSITTTTATLGACINDNCGSTISYAGIVYGLTANPTSANSKLLTSAVLGTYTVSAANLIPNTEYHYRGFAVNSAGISYTSDATFITLPTAPTAIAASSINPAGFITGWTAPTTGGTIPLTYTLDIATNTGFTNIAATYTDVTALNKTITGLANTNQYFYRVKAVNATGGGAYSNVIAVTLPYLVTASAGTGGTISPTGDNSISYGNELVFTATENTGYHITAWYVDSAKVQDGGLTYKLSNITANHTVQATFTAISLPTISSFSPTSGVPGTVVTITGKDFTNASAVSIGTASAVFTLVNDTSITMTIPAGAASGPISITTPPGKSTSKDSFAVLLSSVSLTFSPAVQCVIGKPVIMGATAVGGTTVQFKFMNDQAVLQDFSTKSYFVWNPQTVGTYQLTAVAKDANGTVVYNSQSYIIKPTLSAVTATSSTSVVLVGSPVTITAAATGGASVQYKFMSGTSLLRSFASSNTYTFTPTSVKTYSITVVAQDATGIDPAATVTSPAVNITVNAALSAVSLATSPTGSLIYGSSVTLTAAGTGGISLQYKFMSGTTLIRDFAASNTCTWMPLALKTYPITVIARDAMGANPTATVTSPNVYLTVNAPLTATALTSSPANTVALGSSVTFTATATGGASVQYKFMSGTSLLRSFATSNTYTLSTSVLKTYNITVVAKDINAIDPNAVVTSSVVSITVKPALTAVNLITVPSGTALLAVPVTLYSTVTGGASVQYKFMAGETILRDFTADNNLTWIPNTVGTIPLTVVVRDLNSSTPDATLTSAVTNFIVANDKSVSPVDLAKMVWVTPGTFTMGSAAGIGPSTESPAHPVTLSGYWIYKNVVTVAQYRAFCTATARALPVFPSGYNSWAGKTGWSDPLLQQHPIVNVSWNDAKAYADWAGVKLPTEAQWEYAARGSDGRNYPWGGIATANDLYNGYDASKSANYTNSSSVGKSTWPVGSFPAGNSWVGAQDMAGNVWQWCADWYDVYTAATATDPTGPITGTYRVIRGGSWANYGEGYSRCTFRTKNSPTTIYTSIGFRCVSNTPGP